MHLIASLGSDPEAFLAAVSDSTSSMSTQTRDLWKENIRFLQWQQVSLLILHQPLDLCEHLLHQFARLRKPLGEQTVGVDLDQLTTFEVHTHPEEVGSNYFFLQGHKDTWWQAFEPVLCIGWSFQCLEVREEEPPFNLQVQYVSITLNFFQTCCIPQYWSRLPSDWARAWHRHTSASPASLGLWTLSSPRHPALKTWNLKEMVFYFCQNNLQFLIGENQVLSCWHLHTDYLTKPHDWAYLIIWRESHVKMNLTSNVIPELLVQKTNLPPPLHYRQQFPPPQPHQAPSVPPYHNGLFKMRKQLLKAQGKVTFGLKKQRVQKCVLQRVFG